MLLSLSEEWREELTDRLDEECVVQGLAKECVGAGLAGPIVGGENAENQNGYVSRRRITLERSANRETVALWYKDFRDDNRRLQRSRELDGLVPIDGELNGKTGFLQEVAL